MSDHENWSIPTRLWGAVALFAALFGASPAYGESGRWYTQEQVERGAAVFTQHCAACHGENAQATPNWRETTPEGKYPPPPLNGTAHAWHHPLDVLRRQIRLGGVPLGGSMPAFKDTLSAADIDAAIAYFQSKWDDEIYALWQERDGGGDALVRSTKAAAEDRTTRRLRQRFPDIKVGVPEATPVQDIVLVKAGGQYVYLTADGRYAFVGSLLDLETGSNLTEAGKGRDRLAALSTFPDTDRVIFPAQGEERARLTVFTDTSCGYCRKLHREVPRLQGEGVTVTYVPFPRSGPSGPAYETMRRVWCSPDRAGAMDIAKGVADGALAGGDCGEADAVAAGYELGLEVGVNGTPAIVLPDGRLQPGYLPADRLLGALGLDVQQASLPKKR
jgi:thiol:disulfide interchange protein DsbC